MNPKFAEWLKAEQYGKVTCTTQQSQIRRLEAAYGPLDAAFAGDKFAKLYPQLLYSSADEAAGKPNPSKITIAGSSIRNGLAHLRGALKRYEQFLTTNATTGQKDSWPELKAMRGVFLERCEDFEDFQQTDGAYFTSEREYKNALIAAAAAILNQADPAQPETLGRQYLELLQSKQANFVGWRTFTAISASGVEGKRQIERALGEMLLSKEPAALAAAAAALRIEPILRAASGVAVFGAVRSLVTCALAFSRPTQAIDVKTRFMQRAAQLLLGRGIFKPAVMTEPEYSDFLHLCDRVWNAMVEWGWKPQDLWDVQGFFWVTVDEAWVKDGGSFEVRSDGDTEEETMPAMPIKHALNTIFHGPPGTGKTWTTARSAVEICNGVAPSDRSDLMAEYRKLVEAKRIHFTTFHQSIGYEEFVEGLRPQTSTEGGSAGTGFRLEPTKGMFREICALAEASRKRGGEIVPFDFTGRDFYKMSLGKAWEEDYIYDAAIAGNYIVLGWGGEIDWSDPMYTKWEEVRDRWRQVPGEEAAPANSGNISQLWRFRTMKVGDLVIVSQGNLRFRAVGEVVGDYEYRPETQGGNHYREVRWLAKLEESLPIGTIYDGRLTQASCYPLTEALVRQDALRAQFGPETPVEGGRPDSYVLIIDEINRANVSKVLGELITLLEDDKRLGAENALTVTLPYSGELFGIPNNLYVIGTMNTADRSIAPLDTALRRRFSFVEMAPNYSCLSQEVEGVQVATILKAINQRVEWLFDRDHAIGHGYLIQVIDKPSLDTAMREKIIPLLGEYFYDDWAKVTVALNDSLGRFLVKEAIARPVMIQAEDEGRNRYVVVEGEFSMDAYRAAAGLG